MDIIPTKVIKKYVSQIKLYVVLMYSSDLSYNQTYSMRQISEMCTK